MLNFCDFIQDYVFSTNHHLKFHGNIPVVKVVICGKYKNLNKITKI